MSSPFSLLAIVFGVIYGLMTLAGGVMGFTKGSVVSLISGGLSGLLILAMAFFVFKGKVMGYSGLVTMSAVLAVLFAFRFAKSGAFMPGGMMLLLSAVMMLIFAVCEFMVFRASTPQA